MKKSCDTCVYDNIQRGCISIVGVCKDSDKWQEKTGKTCSTCSYKSGSQCTLPNLDICCGYSKWSGVKPVVRFCSSCKYYISSTDMKKRCSIEMCTGYDKWEKLAPKTQDTYQNVIEEMKKDDITILKNIAKTFGKGVKYDQDKPRYDLIPPHALEDLAKVYAFGAKKYGDRNWEKGLEYNRMYRAAIGHMNQWWIGGEADSESGMSHLTHAAFCVLGLLEYELTGRSELDNRPKGVSK